MLHLAIICIVCAASAPSDSSAINGQKKNESNIFCNFDGGEQNVAKVSFPSVYNVVGRNSSDCAKPGITFFYDYFIKQYQNSKSNSCSIMERVPLGENKNLHSNVDFVYRKRNLLWTTDEKRFQPKTLKPPVSAGCSSCSRCRQFGKSSIAKKHRKSRLPSINWNIKSIWKNRKGSKKFCKPGGKKIVNSDMKKFEKNKLSPKEKKLFWCLKNFKCRSKKKGNLDMLKVDDDLDLNKRIKKLVEQLAEENHRRKEYFEGIIGEGRGSHDYKSLKKEDELSPIFSNIKKMFSFNKDNFNNRIVGNARTIPVSSLGDPDPEKAENTVSSYDVLRIKRKAIRLRRKPHKSYNSNKFSKNRESRYKNNLTGWSNPYSANFKANTNFVYPQRSRKFFAENTKKRRWMRMRMRRNREKKGCSILRKVFERLPNVNSKPACRGSCRGSNSKATLTKKSNCLNCKAALTNRSNRPSVNITGMSQALSLKDDAGSYMPERRKDSESGFKIMNSELRNRERESTTEYVDKSMVKEVIPSYSFERPLLVKQLRDEKSNIIKDLDYKFVTEEPPPIPLYFRGCKPSGRIKNRANALRYLKNRHILRNNIVLNKIEDPKIVNLLYKRRKRHGSKCPTAHKNWRSAPLLCMPYIRKGQEDQLKYLIKVIQGMLGKPIPPKCDIFEQTKFKPSSGKRRFTPRVFDNDEDETNYLLSLPYQYSIPYSYSKLLQPIPPRSIVLSSNIPYEPVNVGIFQENPFGRTSTLTSTVNSTTTPLRTTAAVRQSQTTTTKPVTTCIPFTFPLMERNSPTGSSFQKVASNETTSYVTNKTVTCCVQTSPVTSPVPNLSSPAVSKLHAPAVLQANLPANTPASTNSAGNASTSIAAPTSVSTTTATTDFSCYTNSLPPAIRELSTACASGQRIQPSTVNSCALQESESQNEKECTSAISSFKGEECTTMIGHFSGALSEGPPVQQSVEDKGTPETDSRDVCCADKDNPTAVLQPQQRNSESTGSPHSAADSTAGFKDTETYNSDFLSRIGRSKNEDNRRKLEMIQKLFGKEERDAAFHNKRRHHSKKRSSKSNHRRHKKCGFWMNRFKEQYYRLLEKSGIYHPKTKSNSIHPQDQNNFGNQNIQNNQNDQNIQNNQNDQNIQNIQNNQNNQNIQITKKNENNRNIQSNQIVQNNQNIQNNQNNQKTLENYKCCTMQNPSSSTRQQHNTEAPNFNSPVYTDADNFLHYDHQSQNVDYQTSDNPQQLKSENLLPVFVEFLKGGGPYTYVLNTPPEENENYEGELTTRLPPMNYDAEPQEEVYLKRQKRSDEYYVWPENDYVDYMYDLDNPEENSINLPSLKEGTSDTTWTPPSYDMFSELAKAVAQNEDQELQERSEEDDVGLNSTVKPDTTSVHARSTTVGLNTTTTTTTRITTSATAATASTATAATSTPTTQVNELNETPSEESPTTTPTVASSTASVKIRGKCRSGKKSYERFSKHSGNYKNLVDSREDKEPQVEDFVSAEDIHGPTTLKSAIIVRGQKKFQGKPSPKVYMKVFPDSFENEQGSGEALIGTTARTTETVNIAKTTEQVLAPTKTDLRLQILAVCEGYLEVVKLIKAQNQTLGEDMDESLARYCENIISQNFNFQSEKPKRSDANEPLTTITNKKELEKASGAKDDPELYEDFISPQDSRTSPHERLRDVLTIDKSDDLVSKRKLDLTSKSKPRAKRRKKRKDARMQTSRQAPNLRKRIRRKKEAEEGLEGKEISKEQKQLIRLLRKRKKALLSWLLTTNDSIKPDDLQETEYFDEEDLIDPESDTSQNSGTIKPRRDETSYEKVQKKASNPKPTIYPVYAKDYGYESGGELIEVDVLWRQVNEKTHENKIFKNLSVLALLLTSTPSPKIKPEDTKLVADDSDISSDNKWKKNNWALDAAKMEEETDNSNSTSPTLEECKEILASGSVLKNTKVLNKPSRTNRVHTIISKPDPMSIVGAPTYVNKTHRKISHKYGVAKDIFQEYSIEFLNYAVYILPVMFTVLFLLCCLCCALQILKIQKSHKKRKKKKKKTVSSEDSSDSCTSETESKKRKREAKRKRNPASKENYEAHKKKNKAFWNYLKVYGKPSREMDEENDQTEKKKSFLGFLKSKRDDCKPGYSSAPTRETDDEPHTYEEGRERKHYSEQYLTHRLIKREGKRKEAGQSESAERRELIALLEELKKIETEHIEGKKDVKSVHVQYALPEYDNSVFLPESQIPDFSYTYEKNVFGMPKGVSPFYNKEFQFHPTVPPSPKDYNLYEDVNELTQLLPWECCPQKNDFLKHCDIKLDQTGRCNRFLKIFRDSGMSYNRSVVDKNCKKNESESRSFIFNKYRNINMDKSEELRGVAAKISGTEVRLMENVSPYKLSSNRDEDFVEDVETLKSQLNKKKYDRLKDEGVLCRL